MAASKLLETLMGTSKNAIPKSDLLSRMKYQRAANELLATNPKEEVEKALANKKEPIKNPYNVELDPAELRQNELDEWFNQLKSNEYNKRMGSDKALEMASEKFDAPLREFSDEELANKYIPWHTKHGFERSKSNEDFLRSKLDNILQNQRNKISETALRKDNGIDVLTGKVVEPTPSIKTVDQLIKANDRSEAKIGYRPEDIINARIDRSTGKMDKREYDALLELIDSIS